MTYENIMRRFHLLCTTNESTTRRKVRLLYTRNNCFTIRSGNSSLAYRLRPSVRLSSTEGLFRNVMNVICKRILSGTKRIMRRLTLHYLGSKAFANGRRFQRNLVGAIRANVNHSGTINTRSTIIIHAKNNYDAIILLYQGTSTRDATCGERWVRSFRILLFVCICVLLLRVFIYGMQRGRRGLILSTTCRILSDIVKDIV